MFFKKMLPGFIRRRLSKHARHERAAKRILRSFDEKWDRFHDAQRLTYLKKINPYTFEKLLILALERKGYRVGRSWKFSNDGGIDGRVYVGDKLYLIQAKRYSGTVKTGDIRLFHGLCKAQGCRGYFVHTGKTANGSALRNEISDCVEIISGSKLIAWLKNR